MTIDNYVEQTFPIECVGVSKNGKRVLSKPVMASVDIYKSAGTSMISSDVHCPYFAGKHKQKCIASNTGSSQKTSESVKCPYSFDIHYTFQR